MKSLSLSEKIVAMANTTEAIVVAVPITGTYVPSESRIEISPKESIIDAFDNNIDGDYRVAMHERPCGDCPIYQAGCGGMHPPGIESKHPFTSTVIKGEQLVRLPLHATVKPEIEGIDIEQARCLKKGAQVNLHIAPVVDSSF